MSVDHDNLFVQHQNTTLDAFLSGKLSLVQPKTGFRAGSDSVLLGASVSLTATSLLDLGSGVGAAGLVAAHWAAKARVLLAERDPVTAQLARENILRNQFEGRCRAEQVDISAPGPEREAAGLLSNGFASVIANPPFFDSASGTLSADSTRAGARHHDSENLDRWVRTAVACSAPKGEVIFIYPADRLSELLAAFELRLGNVAVLPVTARPDKEAGRVLVRGIKGSRAPLRLLSPLVLHGETGNHYAPRAREILTGIAPLVW